MTLTFSQAKWKTKPLGDIATIERDAIAPEQIRSGTKYVGLENVTSEGQFSGVSEVSNGELASTKFRFTREHILYGKLRPYLSKIARPDFEGVCSTDILPILPTDRVNRGYLYYFLRLPEMVNLAASRSIGANLPRLSPRRLAEFEIPLPPLPEQKRIADILDKADAIRRKRREATNLLVSLAVATYFDWFGHPMSSNDSKPLGECVTIVSGGTPSKQNSSYWGGDFPWVSPKDMKVDYIADAEDHVTDLVFKETSLKKLPSRSILIVVRGMILAHTVPIALTDVPVAINQDMKALLPASGYLPDFLCWTLKAAHNYILSKVATAAHGTKRLEAEHLVGVRVPNVAPERQEQFADVVRRIRLAGHKSTAFESAELFNSLVQRAFRGEL